MNLLLALWRCSICNTNEKGPVIDAYFNDRIHVVHVYCWEKKQILQTVDGG